MRKSRTTTGNMSVFFEVEVSDGNVGLKIVFGDNRIAHSYSLAPDDADELINYLIEASLLARGEENIPLEDFLAKYKSSP